MNFASSLPCKNVLKLFIIRIFLILCLESIKWVPSTQVQEQQRMAEAVGRLLKLLSILLQELSGLL